MFKGLRFRVWGSFVQETSENCGARTAERFTQWGEHDIVSGKVELNQNQPLFLLPGKYTVKLSVCY